MRHTDLLVGLGTLCLSFLESSDKRKKMFFRLSSLVVEPRGDMRWGSCACLRSLVGVEEGREIVSGWPYVTTGSMPRILFGKIECVVAVCRT